MAPSLASSLPAPPPMGFVRRPLALAAALVPLCAAAAESAGTQARQPAPAVAFAGRDEPAQSRPVEAVLPRELPPRRDLGTRMLIGMGVGAAIGAPAGAVYGYARFEPCGDECMLSRGMETTLYGIMGASAGTVLGTLAGALWPDRRAPAPSVAVAPAGRRGVRVGVMLAR